jgi:hypothetical protein
MRDSKTRQSPPGWWSPGIAMIRWPNAHNVGEAVIAVFYGCNEQLVADYERSARWSKVPGATSWSLTAQLEKTPDGTPWIDFGVKCHYPTFASRRETRAESDRRIAIQVVEGGCNRMKAQKIVATLDDLWLVFALCKPTLKNAVQARNWLQRGCLAYAPETEPIPLAGLSTLGRFVPTGGARCTGYRQCAS